MSGLKLKCRTIGHYFIGNVVSNGEYAPCDNHYSLNWAGKIAECFQTSSRQQWGPQESKAFGHLFRSGKVHKIEFPSNVDDLELRKMLLLVIKGCDQWRIRAIAARMIVKAIGSMPLDLLKTHTPAQLQAQLDDVQKQIANQRDPASIEVEKALRGNGDFLEALKKYVFRLLDN